MASDGKIILFDIPSKAGTAWSFNTWRTRMLLHYKDLDYETEWLEYPEIRTRLEGHVPPAPTSPPYTLPAIRLPSGAYIMHSRAILTALNTLYPSTPSLAYDTPHLARLWPSLIPLMDALEAIYLPRVARDILREASVPYFRATREAEVGMSLEELEARRGGEAAYEAAMEGLRGITEQLGEDSDGPFFGGAEMAQVDLVWVGILLFLKRVGEDVFEELMERCGDRERHEKLLEAVGGLTGRGD